MSGMLVIVGAGGHGREALAVARRVSAISTGWADITMYDDRPGTAVAGTIEDLASTPAPHVIAVGDPAARLAIAQRLDGIAAATLIDPSAVVGDEIEFAEGVMLYPGAICTTNIRVGRHTHLNCGAIVSHDCTIGSFVSLSPGVMLNGSVTVEDSVFLGTGAIVLPGRRVGQGAVVGAGAVVVDDVAPGATVVGVPAR